MSLTLPDGIEPVEMIESPVVLDYDYTPGAAASRFLRHCEEGRLVGQRCPKCGKVYLPPRGSCSMDGKPTDEDVPLPNTGTLITYAVVDIPGRDSKYITAQVLIDGADLATTFLLREIDPDDVRIGMRVEAVWLPEGERKPTLESVTHVRPNGEPDADYETIREYT